MEWIVMAAIAVGGLLVIVVIYNGIVGRMNAVERAWANVITQERQKNNIIPHLSELVEQYKIHEGDLLKGITELRSAINGLSPTKVDPAKLAETELKTASLMGGLRVAVENYPDLKASELYNNLMREISEQQENIGASIRIFNQNVEDFNTGIETFPNVMINAMINKKEKMDTFSDSKAEEGFDYKPNFS